MRTVLCEMLKPLSVPAVLNLSRMRAREQSGKSVRLRCFIRIVQASVTESQTDELLLS